MDNGAHDDHLLPGQRFVPMDDELLLSYLKPMVTGKQVPGRDYVLFECDLYGYQEPWQIWETYKSRRPNDLRRSKDLYFFTKQKKKTPKDSRVGRTVGRGGTWKEESGKQVTSLETNQVVGFKKTFSYKNKRSPHDGCWVMHEFKLDRSQLIDKKQKPDYVLCVLRLKKEPKKKRKQGQKEEMPGDNYVQDNETNLISKQVEFVEPQTNRQRLVRSTNNAPPPPLGFGGGVLQGQLEQCSEPPCIVQTVPLPSKSEPTISFHAYGEENWGQQFMVPSDEAENTWQHMVAMSQQNENGFGNYINVAEENIVNTIPHPHTSSMPSIYDDTALQYASYICNSFGN